MLIEPQRHGLDATPLHHRTEKIAGIEMLRAAAVLMVLYQHMPGMLPDLAFMRWPRGLLLNLNGGAGVDIFFCISGFVVTRSLRRDLAGLSKRPAIVTMLSFWLRRAFRLWPAAWLWLLVAYLVSLSFNRLGIMNPAANLRLIPAGVGMYANFLMIHAARQHQDLGVMSQYWSLSLEEQFYFVLPLLLLFTRRLALPLLISVAAFSFYEYQDFWSDLFLRPGCLVAGVLLSYCEGGVAWRRTQRFWRSGWTGIAVCVALILLAMVIDSITPFEVWLGVPMFRLAAPLESLSCFLIVLTVVQCSVFASGKGLERVLVFLGSRSYALYIVHQLGYAVARECDFRLFPANGDFALRLAVASAITLISIALATESTVRLIEQPFRRQGRVVAERWLSTWGRIDDVEPRSAHTPQAVLAVSSVNRNRITDIEFLRTIAITFVLIEHATGNLLFKPTLLLSVLDYGQLWPGVDLFFVISGFLVTSDLLRRFEGGQHGRRPWRVIWDFWRRRAWRLWPTAWLWLLFTVTGSAVLVEPPVLGAFADNIRGALAGILLYADYSVPDHISHLRLYGASYAYWSLSLEEQFYLLLPILMILMRRRLALCVCLATLLQLPMAHGLYYYFFRSDALLWGVALALWRRTSGYGYSDPQFLRPPWAGLAVLCLALVSLFRMAGTGNVTPPFVTGGIAAISALLVWIASYDNDYLCPPIAKRFAMWGGGRSYALYVAHVPVFQCSAALAHRFFTPGESLFTGAGNGYALLIVVPFMLAAVELTHRYVEEPLRQFGRRGGALSALDIQTAS